MSDLWVSSVGWALDGSLWDSVAQGWVWHTSLDGTMLAQNIQVDIMADMQKGFRNFIESGQVWALLIGMVLGYMFRSLTAY